jgi:hypothetical protein
MVHSSLGGGTREAGSGVGADAESCLDGILAQFLQRARQSDTHLALPDIAIRAQRRIRDRRAYRAWGRRRIGGARFISMDGLPPALFGQMFGRSWQL